MKSRGLFFMGVIAVCGLAAVLAFGERSFQVVDGPAAPPQSIGQTAAAHVMPVAEQDLDTSGNIKVHEQGIAEVTGMVGVSGTVDVGSISGVANVHVQNTTLPVSGTLTVSNLGSVKLYDEQIYPFNSNQTRNVDIHGFSKIRVLATVNGSGTVDFHLGTDSGVRSSFSVSSGDFPGSVLLADVPGSNLEIDMTDPDGEQIFLRVWGSN